MPSKSFPTLIAVGKLKNTNAVTNAAVGQRMYGYLEWTVSSGATQYRSYAIRGQNNTAAFIAFDAEL